MGWLVFTGGPAPLNTYNGIVVAGIRGDTLTLRVAELFSLLHTPLAIPFSDLSVERTRWHINNSSYKLMARRVPEFGMIVPETYLRCIEEKGATERFASLVAH